MTEQEYNDEQAWIAAQEYYFDNICHDYGSDAEEYARQGFDAVYAILDGGKVNTSTPIVMGSVISTVKKAAEDYAATIGPCLYLPCDNNRDAIIL